MELDPDDVFRDEEDDEFYEERDATKELLVYIVDASPKMFSTTSPAEHEEEVSHFEVAINCIAQCLRTQIVNRSYDEVAICFYNTREKKNLQDLNCVYVFNVQERDDLDRPTAKLIREFDLIKERFNKQIGSKYGIEPGSRDNSLYNAIWAAQALLRKGKWLLYHFRSAKTADKRILIFTNEDDPFGCIKGATKIDMMRTTLQRAKDARDLGISIELLPLSKPDEEFNVSVFYAELLGLEGDEIAQFKSLVGERLEDLRGQLRKRIFKKRKVRRIKFIIASGLSIELNTYALIRPTNTGTIAWLDSVTNLPLKTEKFLICGDTGTLIQEQPKRFQLYKNDTIMFSADELSELKRVSAVHLHLLGFKPLSCLKDYHNLRPSTFVFPSDEEAIGSTRIFIALHKSMTQLKRFALAFYGNSSQSRLVALIAQDEITTSRGQIEPPGMHMIFLPYSDDIRHIEELHADSESLPHATDEQIKAASALLKRIDLKDFSVCQFSNPALQRHYAILQALALEEDEMPDMNDETLPDEEGMSRAGVVKALEEFKVCVYGENYDEEIELASKAKTAATSEASKKRKAIAENAVKEYAKHDWSDLADNGQLKDLAVQELKYYLVAHGLPVGGKKEVLISRILNHMGK
ncbi:unnamed protein product [Cuscuta campestris]|uniref:SAP domain-containing protein n=1 Tax=Cuscuta campestris TaxID=132261 RepID=A0A484L7V4_9ASTE|nr:unnamed protein product [Cuscuta campestris]